MLIDAAKYGQIVEPLHGGGTGPLHFSGITPQGHRHPVFDMQNTPAFPERAVRERYQRNELKGFTTQELYDLDAISDRDLPMSTLEIPIHDIFQRWEEDRPTNAVWRGKYRNVLYPLDSEGGLWERKNKKVREIMDPILQLATQIIMSQHSLAMESLHS